MTRQIADQLLFENKEYELNVELLEEYFREFPAKKPEFSISCSALWRGYVAVFEIREHELLIKEIAWLTGINLAMKSFTDEIFPDRKLTWYSGLIRIDDCKEEFDLEPEDGIFEYLQIENGNFIRKRMFDYDTLQTFKREQFEYFLLSEEIETVYEFWRKNNKTGIINKENLNTMIFENIMQYTKTVYAD